MKTVTISLVIMAISCIGLLVFLSIYYMHTMPDTPQMEAKRVYPLNIHGSIVYLTKGQELLLKFTILGWRPYRHECWYSKFDKKECEEIGGVQKVPAKMIYHWNVGLTILGRKT
jgi:hypothetical protein